MKIKKLVVKNYKVFDHLELDFTDKNGQVLDTIVLAGLNGSGKTTILEIIKKMYDGTLFNYSKEFEKTSISVELEIANSEKILIGQFRGVFKGINKVEALPSQLKDALKDTEKLSLMYDGQKSLTSNLDLFFTTNKNASAKFLNQMFYFPINLTPKIDFEINQYLPLQVISLYAYKSQMKQLVIEDIMDEILKNEDTPPRQSKEKAIKGITKALNGMNLTTQLVDIESKELIFESTNGKKIKFEDLSNGEQNLYFRAIYLSKLNPKDSIIMVDEPEDSLHPTWQQKVIKLYQNIGENNQIIVATHSPHIIGSANTEQVFLLEIDENRVEAEHPRYTKGHSIDYILEVMGTNPRNTSIIGKVDAYLAIVRKGLSETEQGRALKAEIDAFNLDPNSEEMRRLDLSLKRFKAVGV